MYHDKSVEQFNCSELLSKKFPLFRRTSLYFFVVITPCGEAADLRGNRGTSLSIPIKRNIGDNPLLIFI